MSISSPMRTAHLWNDIVSICPQILSFILIRNIPGYARSVYSSFFAWFGKISLEVSTAGRILWFLKQSAIHYSQNTFHDLWHQVCNSHNNYHNLMTLLFNMLCLLQLFICQYHIWLAADTKGILVLIPGNPSLNIMVSTFIFVCVAHEISLITNDLAQVVIPKDSVALLKRLGATGIFSLVVLLLSRSGQPSPGA